MANEEVQWRVTWFPPDKFQQTRTGTEELVKRLATEYAGWNPIVESRIVITQEWETVPLDSATDPLAGVAANHV